MRNTLFYIFYLPLLNRTIHKVRPQICSEDTSKILLSHIDCRQQLSKCIPPFFSNHNESTSSGPIGSPPPHPPPPISPILFPSTSPCATTPPVCSAHPPSCPATFQSWSQALTISPIRAKVIAVAFLQRKNKHRIKRADNAAHTVTVNN